MRMTIRAGVLSGLAFGLAFVWPGVAQAAWRVIGWNNLGMHCMDSDYSVFSILPPYNTLQAQVIDASGHLLRVANPGAVTYEAVADPSGSINRTSQGKSNFWQFAQALFGLPQPLAADVGLTGLAMPGSANQAQATSFDASHSFFIAEGIPITPYDDAQAKNPYPMMRLVARDGSGNVVASTNVVLPVSDEMDCRVCHGSGSGVAARPAAGWVNDPSPDRDYRLNILRLHDERRGASPTYQAALLAHGYSGSGLYNTAAGGKPILCAACHASNALGTTGQAGVPPLTTSVHFLHASVQDPATGMTLENSVNRSACYRCHPGSTTRCLRGAMGRATASDGSLAIQCQSCHGPMSAVGAFGRAGWLDEPSCQNCHTGTATHNNGQIRYTSALEGSGQRRVAVDQTFATTPNTPAAGFSLYRMSTGHGGLQCSACHGSTHAEYPSGHDGDNVQSNLLQGYVGMLSDCTVCHGSSPSTTTGGPHGLHPVGQTWVSAHQGANKSGCPACHGGDYRGTVLSSALGNRSLSAFGTKTFWRGFQIGCYTCHNGPSSDSSNSNRAPVAQSVSVSTPAGSPVTIPLVASDPDGNAITLRVVDQPAHGRAGLAGTQATYVSDVGFSGTDSFTYAARDAATDSNLATVTVTVTAVACTLSVATSVPATATVGEVVAFAVTPTTNGCPGAVTYDWDFGDASAHSGLQNPEHTYASAGSMTWHLAAASGSTTAAAQGTVVVGEATAGFEYLFFVAHNPGRAGTVWRSDVAVLNLSNAEASFDLTFFGSTGTVSRSETLPVNNGREWQDAVSSLFEVAGDDQGTVRVSSNTSLVITVRSYTQYGSGTMGQSYPGVSAVDTIALDQEGILPHLRGTGAFRTNAGFLNVSDIDATLSVHLFDGEGVGQGTAVVVNVSARRWVQVNDVFAAAGLSGVPFAYARIQVHTSGSRIWAYASVIDNATGDPTTEVMVKP